MKAYIHIHNEEYFCHRWVMEEIEIEGVPAINSCLYLGEEISKRLGLAISDYYEAHHKEGWPDIYGKPYSDGTYSVEDCIWVYDTCWVADEDGVYRLHIELNDERNKEN